MGEVLEYYRDKKLHGALPDWQVQIASLIARPKTQLPQAAISFADLYPKI